MIANSSTRTTCRVTPLNGRLIAIHPRSIVGETRSVEALEAA